MPIEHPDKHATDDRRAGDDDVPAADVGETGQVDDTRRSRRSIEQTGEPRRDEFGNQDGAS